MIQHSLMRSAGDPSSTNPINTSDRWGLTVTNMIYSPLVTVEADGTTQNALAESVEPAEDGLSLTVHLKQDVKWSDGEDFTADDVVFTYEQKVKKENGNADSLWVDDQPIAIEKWMNTPSNSCCRHRVRQRSAILQPKHTSFPSISLKMLPTSLSVNCLKNQSALVRIN